MTKDFLLDAATLLGGFAAAIQVGLWIRDVLFRAGFTAKGTLRFLKEAVTFQILMFSTIGTVLYMTLAGIRLKDTLIRLFFSGQHLRFKRPEEWTNEWTDGAVYFQSNQDVFFICLVVSIWFLLLAVKSKDPDFYDLAWPLLALDGIVLLGFLGVGLLLLAFGIEIISIKSCVNLLTLTHFVVFFALLGTAMDNLWKASASSRR